MKMFKHIPTYSVFQGLKISANSNDTQYSVGIDGNIINGVPDIKWQSIAFIKDVQKIWTHGQLYDCSTINTDDFVKLDSNGTANISTANIDYLVSNGLVLQGADGYRMEFQPYTNLGELYILDEANPYKRLKLTWRGDGTKFLSDDGSYKTPSGEQNVQSDWNVTDTTSDAYIKNKPTIPSEVTESTVSGWGFTKNTGTITEVKMNGVSKGTSGVVDLGTVITDISGKQDKLVSGTNIATINNNSILGSGNFDLATSAQLRDYQPKLVSGTSIKTINGESILGSGDITISGGGSSSGSAAYPEINHGTSDTVLTLAPNTFHIWDEVESLQLVYARPTAGIANEYLFQFTSGATATTLYLPDTIKWVGGFAPSIKPNTIYQISILNGLGSVLEFDNAISFPVIMEGGNYPDVYSYFVDKYSLTNTSDNPNNGIEIQEYLLVSSSLSGGDVIKVSLNNDNLLLWTEKSEQTYYVMKITSNTFIATEYFWD